MKNLLLASILLLTCPSVLFGQQKYALVIGNAKYSGISPLKNSTNDANDMEAALKRLGFTVEKVLDGKFDKMENAIDNFIRKLGSDKNTYGFFFYAGHGVQSKGDNYLIPVDAVNIKTEAHLGQMAVSLQTILENIERAGNEFNMIVLDACRDNPYTWASRSGGSSRGLARVSRDPAGSYVMYATQSNSTADDNVYGKNGLFTGHLVSNCKSYQSYLTTVCP
jgi:uncharacterized caspase-like protein